MADPADYLRPHVVEFIEWVARVHGPLAEDVLREYRRVYETCPALMQDLAIFCGAFEQSFVAGKRDETARREGMRLVWLRLHGLGRLPEAIVNELLEQAQRAQEHDHAITGADGKRTPGAARGRADRYFEREFGGAAERPGDDGIDADRIGDEPDGVVDDGR